MAKWVKIPTNLINTPNIPEAYWNQCEPIPQPIHDNDDNVLFAFVNAGKYIISKWFFPGYIFQDQIYEPTNIFINGYPVYANVWNEQKLFFATYQGSLKMIWAKDYLHTPDPEINDDFYYGDMPYSVLGQTYKETQLKNVSGSTIGTVRTYHPRWEKSGINSVCGVYNPVEGVTGVKTIGYKNFQERGGKSFILKDGEFDGIKKIRVDGRIIKFLGEYNSPDGWYQYKNMSGENYVFEFCRPENSEIEILEDKVFTLSGYVDGNDLKTVYMGDFARCY